MNYEKKHFQTSKLVFLLISKTHEINVTSIITRKTRMIHDYLHHLGIWQSYQTRLVCVELIHGELGGWSLWGTQIVTKTPKRSPHGALTYTKNICRLCLCDHVGFVPLWQLDSLVFIYHILLPFSTNLCTQMHFFMQFGHKILPCRKNNNCYKKVWVEKQPKSSPLVLPFTTIHSSFSILTNLDL